MIEARGFIFFFFIAILKTGIGAKSPPREETVAILKFSRTIFLIPAGPISELFTFFPLHTNPTVNT